MSAKKIFLYVLFLFLSVKLSAGEKVSGNSASSLPAHSLFGWAVSIYGNFAAVSAPDETYNNFPCAGAVYLYSMVNGEWKIFQRIIPSDPSMMKRFGTSIKLWGYTLLIGAPDDNLKTGSAYVYIFNGAKWEEEQKITPENPIMFHGFGSAVDLGEGIALISSVKTENNDSASGSVYVYNTRLKNWQAEGVIKSPEKNTNDIFGSTALIVSANHILISAPRGSGTIHNCGAVYSFVKNDDGWSTAQTLYSPTRSIEGLFGSSISCSENRLLVGAMQEMVDSAICGAAFLYHYNDAGKWVFEKKFIPENKRNQDYFGMATFINKEILVIGSPKWDINKLQRNGDIGCADVFGLSDSGWTMMGKIIPHDGDDDDHFGMAISSFENTLLIGSRLNDNTAFNNGSAYFYNFSKLFPALSPKFIPEKFELYNNFPNPFNPTTTIRFDLPENTHVKITVYDILGKKVTELINSEQEAGRQQVLWNGKNSAGLTTASGVYIYRIETPKFNSVKKMILLR